MKLFEDNIKGAIISDCGKYRYQLWRIWDKTATLVMFIMLQTPEDVVLVSAVEKILLFLPH